MDNASPVPDGPQEPLIAVAAARSGLNESGFPLTPLEHRVSEALEGLLAAGADPYQLAVAELAMSLATNIAKGNVKGRAVANEATALRESLTALQADTLDAEVSAEDEAVDQRVLSLVERLQAPPAVGGLEARTL